MEEPVGVTVCSRKYQEAVAHAVQVAAAAAPGPQHGCVGHTPRICVPPLDRRSRRSRSGGGPCGLAVRVPPLRRSVELRTGCDQRYATKRCLQLHYLTNASSTGLAAALFAAGRLRSVVKQTRRSIRLCFAFLSSPLGHNTPGVVIGALTSHVSCMRHLRVCEPIMSGPTHAWRSDIVVVVADVNP